MYFYNKYFVVHSYMTNELVYLLTIRILLPLQIKLKIFLEMANALVTFEEK